MADSTRREHIIREVLGGVVLTAVISIISFVPGVWTWIMSVFVWLGENVEIARWWYGLLLAFSTLSLLFWIVTVFRDARSPEHCTYSEDYFFGMVWRWKWNYHGQITDLWCWCSYCDRSMTWTDGQDEYCNKFTVFNCQHCQNPIRRPSGRAQNIHAVEREIDLKVRNGSWKEVVEQKLNKTN